MAWAAQNWERRARVSLIFTEGRELTCKVKVGSKSARALIDTGTVVSLIRADACDMLRMGGRMRRTDLVLDLVNRIRLRIVGIIGQAERSSVGTKLYVAPDLCNELILGEDWLRGHGAQLKSDPPVLTVEGVEILLGGDRDQGVSVVSKGDITLPTRTALTSECVIFTKKSVGKESYQEAPVEKYSGEKEEVTLVRLWWRVQEPFPSW